MEGGLLMNRILDCSDSESTRDPCTIPEVVRRTASHFGDRPALLWRDGESLRTMTYVELDARATAFAIALMDKCSVAKGDHIAMIMDNSPDWMTANLGIQYAGGVDVPRASDTPADTLAHIVSHSDVRIALVQSASLVPSLPDEGKGLDYIIVMDKNFSGGDDRVLRWADMIAYGTEQVAARRQDVLERSASIAGGDLASIIYSSGTTGMPKGAMLTHANYMHNIKYIAKGFGVDENDRMIAVLPVWHAYERQAEYAFVGFGGSIFYSSVVSLRNDLQTAGQTVTIVIPRILNLFYKGFMRKVAASPAKKLIATVLLKGAKRYDQARRILEGEEAEFEEMPTQSRNAGVRKARFLRALYAPDHKTADRLLFSKIREALGSKTRIVISGAGPLPSAIDEFFSAAGLKISEGYGMTETIVVDILRDPAHNKLGTVGKALPEVECRIVKEDGTDAGVGEVGLLKIRGPNVMKGYYKDPELTSQVIDAKGFLSTGDLAKRTVDDYIKIIGRADDTIVLTTGEKVNPALIENELESDTFLDRAIVAGQDRPYLVAIIYPNKQELEGFAAKHGIRYAGLEELVDNPAVQGHVSAIVSRITGNLARFSSHERVKGIKISCGDVTEVSQSLKLKRHEFYRHHVAEIDAIYRGSGAV
jgi:long-chain acyl-CoA synthetase